MTPAEFRKIALSFPEVVAGSHRDHPDFRFAGRVFATLGYPDEAWGMAKLTPEQQAEIIGLAPKTFSPAKGAWGRGGSTLVKLAGADPKSVRHALGEAYGNLAGPAEARRRLRAGRI